MEFLLTSHTELLSSCGKTQLCMGHIVILSFLIFLWSVSKYKTCNWAKIGFYSFQPNFPTKYPISKTIYGYASVLKLDFFLKKLGFIEKFNLTKIKLLEKTCISLNGTWIPCKFFFFWLPITWFSPNRVFHWNSIFRILSLK